MVKKLVWLVWKIKGGLSLSWEPTLEAIPWTCHKVMLRTVVNNFDPLQEAMHLFNRRVKGHKETTKAILKATKAILRPHLRLNHSLPQQRQLLLRRRLKWQPQRPLVHLFLLNLQHPHLVQLEQLPQRPMTHPVLEVNTTGIFGPQTVKLQDRFPFMRPWMLGKITTRRQWWLMINQQPQPRGQCEWDQRDQCKTFISNQNLLRSIEQHLAGKSRGFKKDLQRARHPDRFQLYFCTTHFLLMIPLVRIARRTLMRELPWISNNVADEMDADGEIAIQGGNKYIIFCMKISNTVHRDAVNLNKDYV